MLSRVNHYISSRYENGYILRAYGKCAASRKTWKHRSMGTSFHGLSIGGIHLNIFFAINTFRPNKVIADSKIEASVSRVTYYVWKCNRLSGKRTFLCLSHEGYGYRILFVYWYISVCLWMCLFVFVFENKGVFVSVCACVCWLSFLS
jgi:hypothetical protein